MWGLLIPCDWGPYKKGGEDTDTHRGMTTGGHSEKAAICKPGTEASEDTKPAVLLILDFCSPEP